ncbi:MAG: hypothetical protein Q9O74_06490, partial [Planctomycetota bacterium]|nr:hypothetical protein [Planctomycetota bacterium]
APPAIATDLTTTLRNTGAIELAWEGTIANGTVYTIWRKIGTSSPATLLGAVGARSFIDNTLPAGTPEATYFVRTHRGELSSDDSTHITVRLGVPEAARATRARVPETAPRRERAA